jgi:hypothetical protein
MLKMSSRLAVLALGTAIVLVPTIARARQHVERHDATRLSIKHSWVGVAPPSKASVTPQPVVALPPIAAEREAPRVEHGAIPAPAPALRSILEQSPDPLRGPPHAL